LSKALVSNLKRGLESRAENKERKTLNTAFSSNTRVGGGGGRSEKEECGPQGSLGMVRGV